MSTDIYKTSFKPYVMWFYSLFTERNTFKNTDLLPHQNSFSSFPVLTYFHPINNFISKINYFFYCFLCKYFFFFSFFLSFFFDHTHGMRKFLDQELNPYYSRNPSCCSDSAGSLTCCMTRELSFKYFFLNLSSTTQFLSCLLSLFSQETLN